MVRVLSVGSFLVEQARAAHLRAELWRAHRERGRKQCASVHVWHNYEVGVLLTLAPHCIASLRVGPLLPSSGRVIARRAAAGKICLRVAYSLAWVHIVLVLYKLRQTPRLND